MAPRVKIKPYWEPVGGWGSARTVSEILVREGIPLESPLTLWDAKTSTCGPKKM